jgi:hypothetical protein
MIWDGFEGNQWILCHEADWFVAQEQWKIIGLIDAIFWP